MLVQMAGGVRAFAIVGLPDKQVAGFAPNRFTLTLGPT